jgi:hypothetical protein
MVKTETQCEYLVDNRFCSAITENEEGKDVRNKSCTNEAKDFCCYLCADREICEISCTYLDKPEDMRQSKEIVLMRTEELNLEIKRCEAKIQKLAALYADGRIGEQSYVVTAKTLENKLEKLKRAKDNPNIELPITESYSYRVEEPKDLETEFIEKPTVLWYFVPFFFGIIGGIIAYVATKDEDKEMADSLLIFGIVWTVILTIVYWLILTSVLLRF